MRRLCIKADAFFVAVIHREITRAGPQQSARLVAFNRLDAGDIRAQGCKDSARRRTHHHMGKFYDLEASQRLRRAHAAFS